MHRLRPAHERASAVFIRSHEADSRVEEYGGRAVEHVRSCLADAAVALVIAVAAGSAASGAHSEARPLLVVLAVGAGLSLAVRRLYPLEVFSVVVATTSFFTAVYDGYWPFAPPVVFSPPAAPTPPHPPPRPRPARRRTRRSRRVGGPDRGNGRLAAVHLEQTCAVGRAPRAARRRLGPRRQYANEAGVHAGARGARAPARAGAGREHEARGGGGAGPHRARGARHRRPQPQRDRRAGDRRRHRPGGRPRPDATRH